MVKQAYTPDSLSGLVNTGTEPITSATMASRTPRMQTEEVETAKVSPFIQYKHSGNVYNIKRELKASGSKQVSVKLEAEDYTMLRHCAERTNLNHREIFLEAFDLWIKQHAAKLK